MATILVVDDRPSNRTYLTKLLRRGGHRMLEASDGAHALAQMHTEHPDLVITDILMPTMDGYEFVQRVRSDPGISLTPIIFYTATYSAPQAKALAATCGVSSVLSKPCAQQEILTAVNRELGADESPAGIQPGDSGDGEATAGAAGESATSLPDNPAMTRRVASRLAELLEAGMKMMAERDPARLVELYFSTVCELVHSSYAAVGMLGQDEQTMRHVYAKGMDAALFRSEAGRGGALDSLLRGKRILQTRDAGRLDDTDALPQGHPPVGCMLGIPVSSADRVYGWLYFADGPDGSGFSEEDVFIANAVARQLAMLYENATLYDVVQRHAGKLQMEAAERKRAEDRQREVNQLLDNIVQNIPTAVQLKSVRDGFRIQMWNKAAEAIYGVASNDAIGRTVHDLWPAADAALMHAADLELVATGVGQDFPDRLAKTRSRGDIRVHMRKVVLLDAVGNATHVLAVADDITARKLGEEALNRFSTAMDATADAIYLVDRASMQFVHVNEAACRMQGRSRDEMFVLGPAGVLGISPAELERNYDAIIASGADAEPVEMLRTRGNGEQAWVELRRHAQRSGDRWTIVTLVRDITERKLAAQEFLESERRFSDLLRNVQLASVMLDREARITYCNEYLLQLTGWRLEEVIGRSWVELFIPPESGDLKDRLAALLAGAPEARHGENRIVTRSGERRLIRWNNSVLRSGDGQVIGTASIGEDITEQKFAEIRIMRLNRVYSVLSGINSAIVRIRERDALFTEVCRLAVSEGGFFVARVVELDPNGKARLVASTEIDTTLFQQIVDDYNNDPAHSQSLLALGLRSRQPLISNDVATDPRMPRRAELTTGGTYALALLPIIVEQRIAGVLVLRAQEAGMFDEAELRLLLEVVANLAFALEHIDKDKKVRRLTRVHAVLSGINSLIVRAKDRDELFRESCRIAVEHGQFRMAWIGIVDRGNMELMPVASAGATNDSLMLVNQRFSLTEEVPLGNSLSARAIREKKPFVSNDVQNDARIVFKDEHAKRGSCSMAILPLQVSGEAVGLLALYSVEIGFFDDEEMTLLSELAGDIGFAMNHMEKQERLDYLAYYDELTGLANRTLFLERVAQYIRSAVRGGHKLALFFVDLERFRNINDSLGRPLGDALLKQVSEWLSRAVGDPNLLARLGSDHFAIVLPELKQAGNVAGLLDKRVRAFLDHSFLLDDTEFRIAAKIGVALFPNDGTDADTLLRNAEAALKKAKKRGERYLFYKPKMTELVAGKLSLETQLRQALDKEEFVLHYQPKINLESGKLTGAEALIRWNDPRSGLVPPGRFIPVLEETGLILDVGRWALRQAIGDHLRWRGAGLPSPRIAVNVSPLQLRHRGFIAEIELALGIDVHAAAGLELEITESLIMEDVKHNIASLQAIRALGVTIAIDDFGTGFSSLSYLAKLPVDTLKIDRSFVIDMTAEAQGLSLVSTIINLAHALKLNVVAEGVETEEQSRLLRLLRCDEMQGFLYSKPVPAEIFEAKFLVPAPVGAAA